jgi:RNA polymerase sigma-70 factor, ECF subfamily
MRSAVRDPDVGVTGYHLAEMTSTATDEADLIAALRARDEVAFASLVDRHTAAMLRVARGYVASHEIAEEVVQEAWIALLTGIDGFQGRSSLRTWLFTVLINIAKKRGLRERTDVDKQIAAFTGGTVDPARFRENDDPYPGHWKPDEVPAPFPDTPEGSLLGEELLTVTRRELDKLPERQRLVVTMRDMLDMDSEEVSTLLDISTANQRVLLHRGRAAVRQGLETYVKDAT